MATHGEAIEMSRDYGGKGTGQKGDTVQTSEIGRETSPKVGEGLHSILRVRKLFSSAQIFAFSLTYMSIWESMNS